MISYSDRPTYRDIGFHAIAISLMHCEDHGKLFPKSNWYPHLFRCLDFTKANRRVAGIVTLYYDRSLEHYLSHTLSVSYEGEVRQDAIARFTSFPIHHIHGILGEYSERPYRPTQMESPQVTQIKNAAVGLRITSDPELDSSKLYGAAKDMCEQAPMIMFLGFGYHVQVMSRLGFLNADSKSPVRKFLGSAHKLPQDWANKTGERFGKRLSLDTFGREIEQYFVQTVMQ